MPICPICNDSGFVADTDKATLEVLPPLKPREDGTLPADDRQRQTIVTGFRRCTACRPNDDMRTYPPAGRIDDFGPARKEK